MKAVDLLRVPPQSADTQCREKPVFTSGRLSRIGMLPEDMPQNLSDDEDTVVSIPINSPSVTSISHSDRMSLNMSDDDDQPSKINKQEHTHEMNNSFKSDNYVKENDRSFEDSIGASSNQSIESKPTAQPQNICIDNESSSRPNDIDYLSNKLQSSSNETSQHQLTERTDNCTCSDNSCMKLNNDDIDINKSCRHNKRHNGSVITDAGTNDTRLVTTPRSGESTPRSPTNSVKNGSKHSEEEYSSDDEYSSRFSEINENSGGDELSFRSEDNYDGDDAGSSEEEWEELVMDNGVSEILQSNQVPGSNIEIEILTEVPNSKVTNADKEYSRDDRREDEASNVESNNDDSSETEGSNIESKHEKECDESSHEYCYSDENDFSEPSSNTESDHPESGSECDTDVENRSDNSVSSHNELQQDKKVLIDSIKSSAYEYNTDFEECSDTEESVEDGERTTSRGETNHTATALGNFSHNKTTYSNISLKSFTGDCEPESLGNSIDLRISGDVSCFTESLSQSEFTSQFNLSGTEESFQVDQTNQSNDKEKDNISIPEGLKAVSPSSIVIQDRNENKNKQSDKTLLKPNTNANNSNTVKTRVLVAKNTKESFVAKGIAHSEVTKKNKRSEKSQRANVSVRKVPVTGKEVNKALMQHRHTGTELQLTKERGKKTLGESTLPNINHRDRSPTYAVKSKPFTAETARSTTKGTHRGYSETSLKKDGSVKGYRENSYNTRTHTVNMAATHREMNQDETSIVSKESNSNEYVRNAGQGEASVKNERPSSGDSLLSRRSKMSPTSLKGTRLVSSSSGPPVLKSAKMNIKQNIRTESDKGTTERHDKTTKVNDDDGEKLRVNDIANEMEDSQMVNKMSGGFLKDDNGQTNDASDIEHTKYASEIDKKPNSKDTKTSNGHGYVNTKDDDNSERLNPSTSEGYENSRGSDVTQNEQIHTQEDMGGDSDTVKVDNSQNTNTQTKSDTQLVGENKGPTLSEREPNIVQSETVGRVNNVRHTMETYQHHDHDKHPSRELAKSMITNERRASQSRLKAVHINKRNSSINVRKTTPVCKNNGDTKADNTSPDAQSSLNKATADISEKQSVDTDTTKVERGGHSSRINGKSSNQSHDRHKIAAVPGENKQLPIKDSKDRRMTSNYSKETDLSQTNCFPGNSGVKTPSVHKKEQRACSNKTAEEMANNTDSSQPYTNKSGAHLKRRKYLQKGPTYENLHDKKLLYKKGGQCVSKQMEKSPTKSKPNQSSGLTDLARLQHIRRELNLTDSGDQSPRNTPTTQSRREQNLTDSGGHVTDSGDHVTDSGDHVTDGDRSLRNNPTVQSNGSEHAVSSEEAVSSDDIVKSTIHKSNSSLETHLHRCTSITDDGEEIVSCFLQASDSTANLSAFTCDVIDPLDVTPVTRQHEVLVSNIIRLSSADWSRVEVATTIPICHQYLKSWQEVVIRQLESSGHWSSNNVSSDVIKVEDAGKTVYGVQMAVREDSCVAVVARPRTQCVTLGTQNIAVPSFWDPRVVAHVFGQQENSDTGKQLYFQVVPVDLKTLTDFQASLENDKATCIITASTPLVIMRVSGRSPEAVSFTVPYVSSYIKTDNRSPRPARVNHEQPDPPVFLRSGTAELVSRISLGARARTDPKQDKTPPSKKVEPLPPTSKASNKTVKKQDSPREKSRHVVYIGDSGDIRIKLLEAKNDDSSRNKTLTFSMYERDARVIVFETPTSMRYNEVEKLASSFISFVVKHRVRLRVSQDPTNVYSVRFSATLDQEGLSPAPLNLAQNKVKHTLNPYCSDTETEILLDEGDVINIVFRGNITVLNQKQILYSFHGYRGIRRKFEVQVADQYSQRSLQGYHGSIQVFVLKTTRKQAMDKATVPTTGSEWQLKADFPLNLPKYIKRSPAPLNKAPVAMQFQEPLTVDFICQLSKDTLKDWDIFSAALGVSSARIQSIKQQNRNVVSDRVLMDIIVNWMKKQPVSQNKVEPLLVALRACNKWKLAAELSHRQRAVTLNRSRSLKEKNLQKAINLVCKSKFVTSRWRQVFSHLCGNDGNVCEETTRGIDQQYDNEAKRCYSALCHWQSTSEAPSVWKLVDALRNNNCKVAADTLMMHEQRRN